MSTWCTASYSMIFSSTRAGVRQSMRWSSRKPRLNQERRMWTKSSSTGLSSGCRRIASSRAARIETRSCVPSGAVFIRRRSSWRRGSAGHRKGRRRIRLRGGPIALDGGGEGTGLRAELASQELEVSVPSRRVEAPERVEGAPGEGHHRGLPLGAEQRAGQVADVLARDISRTPVEEPLPRRGEGRDDVLPDCPPEPHSGVLHRGPFAPPALTRRRRGGRTGARRG